MAVWNFPMNPIPSICGLYMISFDTRLYSNVIYCISFSLSSVTNSMRAMRECSFTDVWEFLSPFCSAGVNSSWPQFRPIAEPYFRFVFRNHHFARSLAWELKSSRRNCWSCKVDIVKQWHAALRKRSDMPCLPTSSLHPLLLKRYS